MKGLMGPALSVLSLEAPQDPPVSPSPWGHRQALTCGYIPSVPPLHLPGANSNAAVCLSQELQGLCTRQTSANGYSQVELRCGHQNLSEPSSARITVTSVP